MEDQSGTSVQQGAIEQFLARAVVSGVKDLKELIALVPDSKLQKALSRAEEVNPLKGEVVMGGQE